MQLAYFIKFDRFILKPLFVMFLSLACVYCFMHEWLIGLSMLFMNFLLGFVGSSLPNKSNASEIDLMLYESEKRGEIKPNTEVNNDTSLALAKAVLRIRWILCLTIIVLSLHHGMKWYLSLPFGFIVASILAFTITVMFAMLNRHTLNNAKQCGGINNQ